MFPYRSSGPVCGSEDVARFRGERVPELAEGIVRRLARKKMRPEPLASGRISEPLWFDRFSVTDEMSLAIAMDRTPSAKRLPPMHPAASAPI